MGDAVDAVDFFNEQFARQVEHHDFALNPFESLATGYLRGEVLDLGCGLGNLSLAAARQGCRVLAVDASHVAVERLRQAAAVEGLPIDAVRADLRSWDVPAGYDTIVAIGLLMFFPRPRALSLLGEIANKVVPGGLAVLNVLTEGTTFMDMFGSADYYLFGRDELRERLSTWDVMVWQHDSFSAPENTKKEFDTLIARKPD